MTQFEIAQQQAKEGTLQTPSVSANGGNVDYFGYQLAVHKFNLSIMSKGMTCRGIKLKDLKGYYGLKGRSASDCLAQFDKIMSDYKTKLGL
jgi:hypothetical protein